jgi:hypothetical protein
MIDIKKRLPAGAFTSIPQHIPQTCYADKGSISANFEYQYAVPLPCRVATPKPVVFC